MTTHGQKGTNEVVSATTTFLAHVGDEGIWSAMSDRERGRMTHADVARGRALLKVVKDAAAEQGSAAGAVGRLAHVVEDTTSAGEHWLSDQLVHARGKFHEEKNERALSALDTALSRGDGHATVSANIRAYIALAQRDDETGHALQSTYADAHSRAAILRDGEHIADQIDAQRGEPTAATGARVKSTAERETAVDDLARWLTRWTTIARRVVPRDGLVTLDLNHARHHPAHRPAHPAHGAPPPPPPAAK